MNQHTSEGRDYGFVIGLLTGTLVGAGLTLWLAPRAVAEIRERISDSARRIADRASDQYQAAGSRVGAAVEDLTRKGQDVRDDVAGAVARGARNVERLAVAAKSDRGM